MVSHRTVGLLVLGSQRDEERGEEKRREGMLRWTAKAAFNLAPAASSQLSEGDGVCACVCVSACSNLHMLVSVYCDVLYMSKDSCRSEAAGITVVSGALALGDRDDRIKTHHNTAVIFP